MTTTDPKEAPASPPGADAPTPEPAAADAAAEAAVDAEVVELSVEEPDPQAALRDEVQSLHARLRTVSAAYQQQQAEVAEVRARLERQAVIKEQLRRGEVVSELFDPVENLRRSVDAINKGATPQDAVAGLEMVLSQFMEAFTRLGLEEVPGKGSRFDPGLHEALTTMPVDDAALDNTVIEVFSAGYRIGTRLIRPARVVIGQFTAPVGEA
jgi:molecular chaperone GrpE